LHIRLEEEAKARCTVLQQEVLRWGHKACMQGGLGSILDFCASNDRLQHDVESSREKARSDNEGAAASKEEKRKVEEVNQGMNKRVGLLEQQLQDRTAEVSEQRTAASMAEQRAAVLDAALQQANASTASMAARIAQMVTDANSQARQLCVEPWVLHNTYLHGLPFWSSDRTVATFAG